MTRQKLDGLLAQAYFGWKWANIDFGWSNGHRGFLIPPEGSDSHKAENEWEGQYLKSMPHFSQTSLEDLKSQLGLDSNDPMDISYAALAAKGLRFRKKEILTLPREGDSYVDQENKKYYQLQEDTASFRESNDGKTFSTWKKLES